MKSRLTSTVLIVAIVGSGCASAGAPSGGAGIYRARAHSHNDYERRRPLLDALARGFASVEADVVLRDGVLYIAHAEEEIRPSATLTGLYLEPVRDLVRRNGGSVYGSSGPSVQLLIDVKSEADATYTALDRTLAAYDDILTSWTPEGERPGAVTALLSGNRALALVLADPSRYVALDGRIDDDRSAFTTDLMPMVSLDWESIDPTPSLRVERARGLVSLLHAEGRKVRFWATPDREEVWASLISIGVDYIGTDDVARLERALDVQ